MFNILITAPYMHKERSLVNMLIKEKTEKAGVEIKVDWAPVEERMEAEELRHIIPSYHGIICGDDRFTPKVFEQASNLRVIVKWGTGIDSIDQNAARKHKVKLCRTPDAFTIPVAETTIGMMLSLARRISESTLNLRGGGWEKKQGFTLHEVVVGIIGFGNIGKAVAERLKPFGCRLLVNDIKPISEAACKSLGVRAVDKEEIYQQANVISLHCDLNDTSRHIINEKVFNKLGQDIVLLINTARGPLINEEDLVGALRNKVISGAGLDVFEDEPLSKSSGLRGMENVVLSAHNSNSSALFWRKVHENSIDMLIRQITT